MSRTLLTADSESSTIFGEIASGLPRFDFSLHRVSADFDPSNSEYVQSLVWVLISLVVVGIGLAFFSCIFCIGRKRWNLFGGTVPSYGAFFVEKDPDGNVRTRTYTKREVRLVQYVFFVVFAIVTYMGVVGCVANAQFSQALADVFDVAIALIQSAVASADDLQAQFASLAANSVILGSGSAPTGSFSQLSTTLLSAKQSVAGMKGEIVQYDTYRSILMVSLFVMMMVGAAGGWLVAFLHGRRLMKVAFLVRLLVVFFFVVSPLFWIIFAVQFTVSVAVNDFCFSANQYLADRRSCEQQNDWLLTLDETPLNCSSSFYTPSGRFLNGMVQCAPIATRRTIIIQQFQNMAILLFQRNVSSSGWNPAAPISGAEGTIR